MTPEGKKQISRAVGLVLVCTPLGFGALRALTTGSDFRYLITAIASVVAAWATFRVSAGRVGSRGVRSVLALVLSMVAGAIVAFAQGAASVIAVCTVAGGFALCVTVGGMLGAFAKRAPALYFSGDSTT